MKDALDRVSKTYRETDILGFDDVLDDYERTADILGKGDPIQIDMEDFKIGEEVDGVIWWVPLLESKKAETPWLELQPQEFQNLVEAVQKATQSTWGEIGQRIKEMKDQFTKPQKDVLFTEYRIKKHKIYFEQNWSNKMIALLLDISYKCPRFITQFLMDHQFNHYASI